jgi:hypothetical protein
MAQASRNVVKSSTNAVSEARPTQPQRMLKPVYSVWEEPVDADHQLDGTAMESTACDKLNCPLAMGWKPQIENHT